MQPKLHPFQSGASLSNPIKYHTCFYPAHKQNDLLHAYILSCIINLRVSIYFYFFYIYLSSRHGIRQLRTAWADGPQSITQCPIRPGGSYTYRFTIEDQEGTLWWHAHSSWLRATVYGALIIHPKLNTPYPFPKPKQEVPIILGNKSSYFFFCGHLQFHALNYSQIYS